MKKKILLIFFVAALTAKNVGAQVCFNASSVSNHLDPNNQINQKRFDVVSANMSLLTGNNFKKDLIISNFDTDNISIYRNTGIVGGVPTFNVLSLNTADRPNRVLATRLNADMYNDIIVTNNNSDSISVFLYNTSTSNYVKSTYAVGNNPIGIAGKTENNGILEYIAVANFSSHSISILLNSNGIFNSASTSITFSNGVYPIDVSFGEYNVDGYDLAVLTDDAVIHTYKKENGYLFSHIASSDMGNFSFWGSDFMPHLRKGDFNNDGIIDLAFANTYSAPYMSASIAIGNGQGGFAVQQISVPSVNSYSTDVNIDDFNGDNIDDIAMSSFNFNKVYVFLGKGHLPGTFTNGIPIEVGTINSSSYCITSGDINMDGKPDLITSNHLNINNPINDPDKAVRILLNTTDAFAITGNTLLCQSGTSTVLTAEGTGPFSWNEGLIGNSTTVSPLETTSYYVDGPLNAQGCYTRSYIVVRVSQTTATIISENSTLKAIENNASGYQWINCSNNTIIPGETGQTYTATNGNYAVIITNQNGCTDTSDCFLVNVGITKQDLLEFNIFPIPNNGNFTVQVEGYIPENSTLNVIDLYGKSVKKIQLNNALTNIQLGCGAGVYFVKIENEKQCFTQKIIIQ